MRRVRGEGATRPCRATARIRPRKARRATGKCRDHFSFNAATEGRDFSKLTPSFLGARYAPMKIAENMMPANLKRAADITEEDHFARAQLQELLNMRFIEGRDIAPVKSHAQAYARVNGLMSSEDHFATSK